MKKTQSIRLRLLGLMLACSILPAVVLGVISSVQATRSMLDDAVEDMEVLVVQKATEIERYLDARIEAVVFQADDIRLDRYLESHGTAPSVNHEVFAQWMRQSRTTQDFDDILLVDLDGLVHYSAASGPYPDMDLTREPFQSTAAGVAFHDGLKQQHANAVKPVLSQPSRGRALAIPAPVMGNTGLLGFLIADIVLDDLIPFYQFDGLGSRSLELVVGTEIPEGIYFLSSLRKLPGDAQDKVVLNRAELAEPMQNALAHQTGTGTMRDYVGDHVIAAWTYSSRYQLGIVVKVDRAEILKPVSDMQRAAIPAIIVVLILLVAIAIPLSQHTSKRLRSLETATRKVAEGQLDVMVPVEGSDEIGALAESFNVMTRNLTASVASREDLEREVQTRIRLEKETAIYTAQLQASNKDLEQFAYVASHDLQEPLRMVASYTQLLEKRYGDQLDDDAHEFIKYAADGARRMQQLINDLLQYSRISTRGKPFEDVDLHEIAGRALATARNAPGGSEAIFLVEDLPMVQGDGAQLERVFSNLFTNAIKFRGEDPPLITISCESQPDFWIISVKDNGMGVDPQFHERIFQIFQRLHGTREYPGTGLGLAICQRVVQRHGGQIWIESVPGLASGSRFRFSLPKSPIAS